MNYQISHDPSEDNSNSDFLKGLNFDYSNPVCLEAEIHGQT